MRVAAAIFEARGRPGMRKKMAHCQAVSPAKIVAMVRWFTCVTSLFSTKFFQIGMSGKKCFLEMNQLLPTHGQVLQATPAFVPAVKKPVVRTRGTPRPVMRPSLSRILFMGPMDFMVVMASYGRLSKFIVYHKQTA